MISHVCHLDWNSAIMSWKQDGLLIINVLSINNNLDNLYCVCVCVYFVI